MLYTYLGYPENSFPAGLGWHAQIANGFHQKAIWTLAALLKVKATDLAPFVGFEDELDPANKNEPLSEQASDCLFRLASAYQRLFIIFKDATPCLSWLKSSRRELQGLRPLEMLQTTAGGTTVFEAIEKIKPPKKNDKSEPAPPSAEEESEDDDEVRGVDERL